MSVKFSFNHRNLGKKKPFKSASENKGLSLKGKNGSAVILIHGLTGTPHEMSYVGQFLNQKGYSVSCPRIANHGEPIEILKHTKWEEFYQSVRENFLRVEEENEGGPIYVVGLCTGALLGLLLADEFGERISALSCLSVTFFYDGWNVPWYRHLLLPLAYWTPLKYFGYFKEGPPYGIKNKAIRERVDRYYRHATLDDLKGVSENGYPYVPGTLFYQNRLLMKHAAKRLPFIRVPIQLIQAREDDTTSVKNSKFVYDRVASPVKELVLLDNSYHIVTVDQEREKVADELDKFFSKIHAGSIS